MNSSLDNYLVSGQMARNKVRVKGIEIVSAPSLLSTDIFVYTQIGDTYKWQIENRDPRKLTPIRVFNTNSWFALSRNKKIIRKPFTVLSQEIIML